MARFSHPKPIINNKIRCLAATLVILPITSLLTAFPTSAYQAPDVELEFAKAYEQALPILKEIHTECKGDDDCEGYKLEHGTYNSPFGPIMKSLLSEPFQITRLNPKTGEFAYQFSDLGVYFEEQDIIEPEFLETPTFNITWEFANGAPSYTAPKVYFLNPNITDEFRPDSSTFPEDSYVSKMIVELQVMKNGSVLFEDTIVFDFEANFPNTEFHEGMIYKLYFGPVGSHYHYAWPYDLCPHGDGFESLAKPKPSLDPGSDPSSDVPTIYPNSSPYPDRSLSELYQQAKDKADTLNSNRKPASPLDSSSSDNDSTQLALTSSNQLASTNLPLSPNTGEGTASITSSSNSQNLVFLINIVIVLSVLNLAIALFSFGRLQKTQKSQKKS